VTLKPGLGLSQAHQKLYHSIRHPRQWPSSSTSRRICCWGRRL